MTARTVRRLTLTVGLSLILALALTVTVALAQGGAPSSGGYYYTVQPGDSWLSLSWRTGIPVADLKAANPTALHPRDWLWKGERLFIPAKPTLPPGAVPGATPAPDAASAGIWYQVKAGDNWQIVARDSDVSVLDLWHANPMQLRANGWLYAGQWLWIPNAATPAPAVTPIAPAATAAPVVTATRTLTPTRVVTLTVALTATQVTPLPTLTVTPTKPVVQPTATVTTALTVTKPAATAVVTATKPAATAVTATVPVSPTASAAGVKPAAVPSGCPAGMAAYADAIAARLNQPNTAPTDLTAWLKGCGAIQDKQGSVTVAPITGPTSKDVIVALRDPATDQVTPRGLLLVYHASAKGYALARKVEGAGPIALLKAGDVNTDGKPDRIWTDTTCGAHTCFSTLFVESWDGKAYQDWIVGEPTIAYGEYAFTDTLPAGSGDEILVHGGVIASAGAGPQRAWTETYVSPKGGPYELFNQVYDDSKCLYHHVLDANKAFGQWTSAGFEPAIKAYQAAINDTALEACGSIKDEAATLRDFARFRLIVALVGGGKSPLTAAMKAQMTDQALTGAADTFLTSYHGSGSVIQACRDVTTYAVANPASWNFLAAWGYANPAFTAQDLCPLN
ncbi:MAG: LysM domain-containing protein [Chloroflexi bacterium]|nr:LysM domain-containing protein [Chloroflexota bacterium]